MDDRLLVLRMAAWMEKQLAASEPTLDLEKASGYSENRLRQKFYNITGETPAGYLRKRRLTEAARALMAGECIADVAIRYGYSSQDNFTTAFKSWFGIPPGKLRTIDREYRDMIARMKEPLNIMELANLKQSPLSATLMSSVKGASDFFDLDWTLARLFGYSGHAFMINIHADLCPSSPYVWNKDGFFLALRNMGIRRTGTIRFNRNVLPAELSQAETQLKAHLDAGNLAILDFLEHQLLAGYDTSGFLFLQPWNGVHDVELPSLSFGTWSEALEREGWVQFTLLEKEPSRADDAALLQGALAVALRVQSSPEDFQMPGYQAGDGAWEWWMAGIDKGLGASHGHWWSATVWRECRTMAASFFEEIEPSMKSAKAAALCRDLSISYRECAGKLGIAGKKDAKAATQKTALAEGRDLDRKCAEIMKELLDSTPPY
jgi:AraC-like DNA-binding protein